LNVLCYICAVWADMQRNDALLLAVPNICYAVSDVGDARPSTTWLRLNTMWSLRDAYWDKHICVDDSMVAIY